MRGEVNTHSVVSGERSSPMIVRQVRPPALPLAFDPVQLSRYTHAMNPIRRSPAVTVLVAALVASGIAGCSADALSRSSLPGPAVTHARANDPDPVAGAISPSPTLAALMPVSVLGAPQPNGLVVAQRLNEQGPLSLPSFTPKGNALFATYACVGPGKFAISGLFTASPCDGKTSTVTLRGQSGKALTWRVNVDVSTRWELLLQDGEEGAPSKQ